MCSFTWILFNIPKFIQHSGNLVHVKRTSCFSFHSLLFNLVSLSWLIKSSLLLSRKDEAQNVRYCEAEQVSHKETAKEKKKNFCNRSSGDKTGNNGRHHNSAAI